jgi:SAM-dependent methyltransferase
MMKRSGFALCYPESRFGGFSRVDGTVAFYSRAQAVAIGSRNVLIIGCGRGKFLDDPLVYRRQLQDFRSEGRCVIGIDIDESAAVNPSVDEFRLINEEQVWPVESGTIDFACGDFVLEHIDNPSLFFSELQRVLRPGAVACFRTPNRWSYVPLLSGMIPESLHHKVLRWVQPARKECDVFPTFYRCNSLRSIRNALPKGAFEHCVLRFEGEPAYFGFSQLAYRLANSIQSILPSPLRSTLFVFLRKQ